jgi:hypothetical protein
MHARRYAASALSAAFPTATPAARAVLALAAYPSKAMKFTAFGLAPAAESLIRHASRALQRLSAHRAPLQ